MSLNNKSIDITLHSRQFVDKDKLMQYTERVKKIYNLIHLNINIECEPDVIKFGPDKVLASNGEKGVVPFQPVRVVYGKSIRSKCIDINSLKLTSGKITVCGEIFDVYSKELHSGKKLISFGIFDSTSSMTCKIMAAAGLLGKASEYIVAGWRAKVRGDVVYDKYVNEICIKSEDVEILEKTKQRSDEAEFKRVELHLHTKMSAMDGFIDVEKLIKLAAEWRHKAVAITDHGVVQAFPEAYKIKMKNNLDIKIIYGMECYLLDDEKTSFEEFDFSNESLKRARYHAVLLAKNQQGLKNLYKLVSFSHLRYFYKRPLIPKSVLVEYRQGIIVGSGCEQGELYQTILRNEPLWRLEKIAEFYDYLEIQPIANNSFMLSNGMVENEQILKDNNKMIVELGERLNKIVIATCDAHFLESEDEIYRRVLFGGQGYSDGGVQPPLFFRTTNEMLDEFNYLGQSKAFEVVVTNCCLIADMIEHISPLPKGSYPPKIEGASEQLLQTCQQRAAEIYGDNLPDIVQQRIDKEIKCILKNNFADMYVIAQILVKKSNDAGYLVGSRGSVGSSFVAFLMGITEVNALCAHYICPKCKHSEFISDSLHSGVDLPSKACPDCNFTMAKDGHNIPFETFLGFDGNKTPDIDLNFSGEYQSIAHKETEAIFGESYVFKAGTISSIQEKTALGFAKKYFEMRGDTVNNAELKRSILETVGVKRTTSQHPGGIIIVPKDKEIYDFCPVQHPADDRKSGVITTHFDFHSIDENLLKLDLLGHDDPTALKMLSDLTGIDYRAISLDDKQTMSLFYSTEALGVTSKDINSEVGTFGVPEFGTKFVRQLLVDTKPQKFSELLLISGVSHGTNIWLNNAQDLIKSKTAVLTETICLRDDIMTYLIHCGLEPKIAFDITESVRKGRGLTPQFEKEMRAKNVPKWYITSCKKIKYLFPKAHAVAYVTMAFKIAWFKINFPIEFYITYFTVRANLFDTVVMTNGIHEIRAKINEIRHKGRDATVKDDDMLTILELCLEMYCRNIKFLPVDLYRSDVSKFLKIGTDILPPLIALQGLGAAQASSIAKARDDKPFLSWEDLKQRAHLNKSVIDILAQNGALRNIPELAQLSMF